MLQIYKAIDIIDIIPENSGRTKPWVIIAKTPNGLKPFVVKLFTSHQVDSASSVTNEVVCNALAKEFDFSPPEMAFIDIPEDLVMAKSAVFQIQFSTADPRLKFATAQIQNVKQAIPELSKKFYTKRIDMDTLFAFDNLIRNADRGQSKTNLLVGAKKLHPIDHEMALKQDDISVNINNLNIDEKFTKYHLFYPPLKKAWKKTKIQYFDDFSEYLRILNLNRLESYYNSLTNEGFAPNKALINNWLSQIQQNSPIFVNKVTSILNMNKQFTYSVLQYKHNLILGEALNVGILFYFPLENKFEFIKGDGYRVKSVYPDFDNSVFNTYLKTITNKVKHHIDLFNEHIDKGDFSRYIHQHILAEDASGLIFKEPVTIKTNYDFYQNIIEDYSKLLLPGILTEKPILVKHNENFILRQFTGYIFEKNKSLEKKFKKNEIIKTQHFTVKFELSWHDKTNNFIKPLSFDLADEISIQHKAAVIYSQLIELAEYAKVNKSRFDILIAKPQAGFNKEFANALDFIDSAKAPKNLITEDKWLSYTQETINALA